MDWFLHFKVLPKPLRTFISALFLGFWVLISALILIGTILLLLVVGTPLALLGNSFGFNAWYQYDCLFNWLLGGDIKETISSRLAKSIYAGHPPVFMSLARDRIIAVLLHQLDPDHVRKSIIKDQGRRLSDEQFIQIMSHKLDDALKPLGVPIW